MNRLNATFSSECFTSIILLAFISFFAPNQIPLYAQYDENKLFYSTFDSIIGNLNSGVFEGSFYIDKFRDLETDHKFFETKNFREGWVIYDNQFYCNAHFNYDVHSDNLLVINIEESNAPVIVLDKSRVHSFEIDKHRFLNRDFTNSEDAQEGFFEILLRSDSFNLLKKHQKKVIKKMDDGVSYKFKDKPEYYLENSDGLHRLNRPKDIIEFVPEQLALPKDLQNSIRKSYKNSFEASLLDLTKKILSLSTKKVEK